MGVVTLRTASVATPGRVAATLIGIPRSRARCVAFRHRGLQKRAVERCGLNREPQARQVSALMVTPPTRHRRLRRGAAATVTQPTGFRSGGREVARFRASNRFAEGSCGSPDQSPGHPKPHHHQTQLPSSSLSVLRESGRKPLDRCQGFILTDVKDSYWMKTLSGGLIRRFSRRAVRFQSGGPSLSAAYLLPAIPCEADASQLFRICHIECQCQALSRVLFTVLRLLHGGSRAQESNRPASTSSVRVAIAYSYPRLFASVRRRAVFLLAANLPWLFA